MNSVTDLDNSCQDSVALTSGVSLDTSIIAEISDKNDTVIEDFLTISTIQPTLQEAKEFVNNILKQSALPVSPAFSVEEYSLKDKNDEKRQKFNGKNPSYISNGFPKAISHSNFREKQPSPDTYRKTWEFDKQQGVGILFTVNKNCIGIDFDLKRFMDDEQRMKESLNRWISSHPKLEKAYIERTRSGGYHLIIRLKELPDYKLFMLEELGFHCGEILSSSDFCVIAPTEGYEVINLPANFDDIPLFENLEELGIFPHKKNNKNGKKSEIQITEQKDNNVSEPTGGVTFEKLISAGCQDLLKGIASENDDKSALLVEFAREVYGWDNWLLKNNYPPTLDNLDDLIHTCGNSLGFDTDRVNRIVKGIEVFNCLPAIHHFRGDEACVKKLRKISINRRPYQNVSTIEETILMDSFQDGEGDWAVLNGAFVKYSGEGYWKIVRDDVVEQYISQELRKVFSYRKTKDGIVKEQNYATEKNKVNAFKFARSCLFVKSDRQASNRYRCFEDVTIDLTTGNVLAHSKDHFLTSNIKHEFIKNADCPKVFLEFIETSFGLELLPLIRAITGMLLDPTAPYGYFPHVLGDSGSGKGTLARGVWSKMYDSLSVTTQNQLSLFNVPEKCHQYLAGKALCVFPDLLGFQDKLGGFYEAIDNGKISCRPLFSNHTYSDELYLRVVIASTSQLSLENAAEGLLRRIIPIPTKPVKKGRVVNINLEKELESELGNIISWALSMNRKERDDIITGATKFEAVAKMKKEQSISSNPVMAFVDCSLLPEAGSSRNITELFNCYTQYCLKFNHKPLSLNVFSKRLKVALPDNFIESKVARIGGRNERIPSFLQNIKLSDAYYSDGNGNFTCNAERCIPGCLEEIENFEPEEVAIVVNEEVEPEEVEPVIEKENLREQVIKQWGNSYEIGKLLYLAGDAEKRKLYKGFEQSHIEECEKSLREYEQQQLMCETNKKVLAVLDSF